MLLLGVAYGMLAAAAHAVAFAFSRRFIVQGHGDSLKLVVLSHTWMGPVAAALLVPLFSPELRHYAQWVPPMLGATISYLMGQAAFSMALKHTASSRIVPLLGLKVVVVAVFSVLWLSMDFGSPQYTAIGLSLAAGTMLHHIGGRMSAGSLALTLLAVCFYALSDLYIFCLVPQLGTGFIAAARSVCVCYAACGLFVLPLLPWYGSRRSSDWVAALPNAAVWLPSMFVLFASIAICGPVLANIAIGTRGLFAILLGSILAARGMVHLEHHASRGVVVRRLMAAGLMIAAIALYGWK